MHINKRNINKTKSSFNILSLRKENHPIPILIHSFPLKVLDSVLKPMHSLFIVVKRGVLTKAIIFLFPSSVAFRFTSHYNFRKNKGRLAS